MEISVNSSYFRKTADPQVFRTDLEAAMICRAAGIRVLDCSASFQTMPDYEGKAHALRQDLEDAGMRVEQTHAPYNRYTRIPVEEFKEKLWHSFDTARILGAKYVVIHADEYPRDLPYDSQAAQDYSYELFAPYVDFAAKHGFGVAVENLFDESGFPMVNGRNRYCSTIEEQLEFIDRYHTPTVTACWDFGHANVAFGKHALDKLKLLGNRLSCTHVHDNEGDDYHRPLYFGKINWKAYADYLKESYIGVFTYEFVYNIFPQELLVDYLALAKKTADHLLGQL